VSLDRTGIPAKLHLVDISVERFKQRARMW